jgi:hypothetical protein
VERTLAYNQVIQILVPDSENLEQFGLAFSYWLTVDSLVLDSVTGFPSGITVALNPANGHFYGGSHACAVVSGTTTDTVGSYPIIFHGTISLSGNPIPFLFSGDTTVPLSVLQASSHNPFSSNMLVINPGDSCRGPVNAGISDFNSALNAILSVYPNPNNGLFELKLNPGGRLNGEIRIVDITGRMLYNQKIDIMGLYNTTIDLSRYSKGLYTLQLISDNGFASKNISIE